MSYERTQTKNSNQFDPTAEFKSTKISWDVGIADFHFELLQKTKLTFLLPMILGSIFNFLKKKKLESD